MRSIVLSNRDESSAVTMAAGGGNVPETVQRGQCVTMDETTQHVILDKEVYHIIGS